MSLPMAGAFPAPLCDYVKKFNARQYMAAAHHEEMVVVWNRAQSHLYRGLMILAAAFVHLERGNSESARIKFRKARDQLASLRPHYLGVDVAQIVERIDQTLTTLEDVAPGQVDLPGLVPVFSIRLDPGKVRGDEVELRTPKRASPLHIGSLDWSSPAPQRRARQLEHVRGKRDAALIELGLCGLRVFETTGISLGDVYLDRMQVRFTQKGGDIAYQPITPAATAALTEWLRVRPRVQSDALFVPLPPRGPKPQLTARSAERILHHYVALAGIPKDVAFHLAFPF